MRAARKFTDDSPRYPKLGENVSFLHHKERVPNVYTIRVWEYGTVVELIDKNHIRVRHIVRGHMKAQGSKITLTWCAAHNHWMGRRGNMVLS